MIIGREWLNNSNDFIFVKSETLTKRYAKRQGWRQEPKEIIYEPIEEEEQWIKKDIKEQISSTVTKIQKKELKDSEKAYIVVGISTKTYPRKEGSPDLHVVFDPNVSTVLKHLSAEVLSYLNVEHNKLLVSCPLAKLSEVLEKKRHSHKYFKDVKRISPMLFEEQVPEHLRRDSDWDKVTRPLLIELVPNISADKRKEYTDSITKHLEKLNVEHLESGGNEFISANLKRDAAIELLQSSNFVFRVSEVPEGLTEKINTDKKKSPRHILIAEGVASTADIQNADYSKLPVICLLDSGVSDIPQLNGLVVSKDGYRFQNLNDDHEGHGHGTPIACLAVYGEGSLNPKARIISYKIYSDSKRNIDHESYRRAIVKFSNQTRIFLSSINFVRENPGFTKYLDRLIQENNVCAVFSAGNISSTTVKDLADRSIPCSSYIYNYAVQDPAQAVNIVAVGAISKKESPNSISRKNELSPFSRCSVTNTHLYQCPKPEFVQHGGNICKDGTILGVESFDKNGSKVDEFLGTSFSAPLFANNLAEIEAKYGKKIYNTETLKAIALASSSGSTHKCMGFGETNAYCFCDDLHALVYSEGEIPLPDITGKEYNLKSKAHISISIPKSVSSIKMFIVHSDNNHRVPMTCLNTYLKVYARKTGRERGNVDLINPSEQEKKSHMKAFEWAFETKSMEAKWDFDIQPDVTADMLPQHKKETTIRYGCAILVTSRAPIRALSLSEEMRLLNKEKER